MKTIKILLSHFGRNLDIKEVQKKKFNYQPLNFKSVYIQYFSVLIHKLSVNFVINKMLFFKLIYTHVKVLLAH